MLTKHQLENNASVWFSSWKNSFAPYILIWMTGFMRRHIFRCRRLLFLFFVLNLCEIALHALGTGAVNSRGLSNHRLGLHTAGLVDPFCNISLLFGRYLPWRTTMLALGRRRKPCQSYCAFSSPSSMWSWQSAVQPGSIFWFWLQHRRVPNVQATGSLQREGRLHTRLPATKEILLQLFGSSGFVRTPTHTHTHVHTERQHQFGVSWQWAPSLSLANDFCNVSTALGGCASETGHRRHSSASCPTVSRHDSGCPAWSRGGWTWWSIQKRGCSSQVPVSFSPRVNENTPQSQDREF